MIRNNLFAILLVLVSPMSHALKVMIDPGHGGVDTGAAYGPAQESAIVLKISQELIKKLKSDPRFEVGATRFDDQSVTLSKRVNKAAEFQADLFISLHANATPDKKAKGMEVYFQNQIPMEEDNLFLAHEEIKDEQATESTEQEDLSSVAKSADIKAILDDLKRLGRQKLSYQFSETLQKSWIGHIRQAPFYVISKNKTPSVLIEVGFISHGLESQKLLTSSYQKELAEKIYLALIEFSQKSKTANAKLSQID